MTSSIDEESIDEELSGQILDDLIACCRSSGATSLDELCQRHPQHARRLQAWFPIMCMMEQVKPPRSVNQSSSQANSTEPLRQINDHQILKELGRGGMGVVYEAWQVSLGRHVALKVMSSHLTNSTTAVERFRREARAAAQLHHTNIVPVFDVGQDQDCHYYTMPLIRGKGLDQIIRESRIASITVAKGVGFPTDAPRLSLPGFERVTTNVGADLDFNRNPHEVTSSREPSLRNPACATPLDQATFDTNTGNSTQATPRTDRDSGRLKQESFRSVAKLGLQLADALAYAHSRGTIHRDSKPSNILIDQTGNAFITDFGLAYMNIDSAEFDGLDAKNAGPITQTGEICGTLRYMAPERLKGQHTAAGDIYSLGATLYEMVTLRPMFDESDRVQLLGAICAGNSVPLRTLVPRIPRDLETIIRKATATDTTVRYSDIRVMADDLRLLLLDRPIRSRRISTWERALRWCRRNRTITAMTTVILGLIVVLTIGRFVFTQLAGRHAETVSLLQRTEFAERESNATAKLRDVARYRQTGLAGLADRLPLIELDASALSENVKSELRNEWLSCLARADWTFTQTIPCIGSVAAVDVTGQWLADVTGPQQVTTSRCDQSNSPEIVGNLGFDPLRLEFSSSGRYVIAQNWEIQRCHFIDREKGSTIHSEPQIVRSCSVHDATEMLVLCALDNRVLVQSLKEDDRTKTIWTFKTESPPNACRFDPSGTRLAIQDQNNVTIVHFESSVILWQFKNSLGLTLEWSPDGRFLAVTDGSYRISILDIEEQRIATTLEGHKSAVFDLAWHPSSNYLASESWDAQKYLWNVRSGRILVRSTEKFADLCFDSSGRRLGWRCKDGCIQLAEWTPGMVIDLPFDSRNGTDLPLAASLHPAGRLLAVRTYHYVHLLDVNSEQPVGTLPAFNCAAVAFSPSGDRLIIVTKSAVQIVPIDEPADAHATAAIVIGPPQTISLPQLDSAVISADGLTFLAKTQSTPNLLSEFRVADGQLNRQVGACDPGQYVADSGQGRHRVLTGWHTTSATILSAEGERLATIEVPKHCVVAESCNSKYVTTSAEDYIQFRDTPTMEPTWRFPLDSPVVGPRLAFHPTEPLFSVRLLPNRLGFVDPDSKSVVARIDELHESWVQFALFAPDGENMFEVCSHPHCIRVWKVGELRRALDRLGLNWKSPVSDFSSQHPRIDNPLTVSHQPFTLKSGRRPTPDGTQESRLRAIEAGKRQLDNLPDDPGANNTLSWNLLLAPEELRDNALALQLSRKCNEAVKGQSVYRNTLGLALYRNQLWDEARETLLLNLDQSTPDQLTLDLVILALTALQNKEGATGESYYIWARKNFADHPPIAPADYFDARQLFEELEELRRNSIVAPLDQ